MIRSLALVLALTLYFTASSQETVVWASEVVDVSSEYGRLEYSAIQALHKPNVMPAGGANPNAWRPKTNNTEEFIVVSFAKPIRAKQVAIAESENPGAIKAVYAYNEQFDEFLLFELSPRALPIENRLLNLFFEETSYEVYGLKVVLDGEPIEGYSSIDAIGLSSSNIPITVLINLVPGVNESVKTEKLGKNVNSQYVEHSPIISPDGKRLYFSRRYHPNNMGGEDDSEDIWMSELDDETGEWKPAVNVGAPLNNAGPNFISSITVVDGEEVLLLGNRYGKHGRMYAGVSYTKRTEKGFQHPESIEIENEYNYAAKADFFMDPSGNAMLLSVERDDSYGGRDLYVSFKNGKIWSEPVNLGSDINTSGDDFAPFLAQDSKTLYYSTNGISGYGGTDIFVALRLDNTYTKWSIPENLGSGVNSPGDDQYFSIPASGRYLYFARGQQDKDTDIYRLKAEELFVADASSPVVASLSHLMGPKPDDAFITVTGKVMDAKTGERIDDATVIIERLPDGVDVGTVKTEGSTYQFTVRAGARYGLLAKLDGYLSQNQNFDFNEVTKSKTVEQDLLVTKIEKEATIVINNIFFDFDKAVLKTSSYPELNRILGYMNHGEIKKIQIAGHTDAVGDDAYNQRLSEQRAKAVYDYFKQSGISWERMEVKGYGETQPKYPNDTDANRRKNRRVEFQILESE